MHMLIHLLPFFKPLNKNLPETILLHCEQNCQIKFHQYFQSYGMCVYIFLTCDLSLQSLSDLEEVAVEFSRPTGAGLGIKIAAYVSETEGTTEMGCF